MGNAISRTCATARRLRCRARSSECKNGRCAPGEPLQQLQKTHVVTTARTQKVRGKCHLREASARCGQTAIDCRTQRSSFGCSLKPDNIAAAAAGRAAARGVEPFWIRLQSNCSVHFLCFFSLLEWKLPLAAEVGGLLRLRRQRPALFSQFGLPLLRIILGMFKPDFSLFLQKPLSPPALFRAHAARFSALKRTTLNDANCDEISSTWTFPMHVWWKCLFTRVQSCQCALITAATTASLAAPTDWSNFSTLTKDCSSRRTGVARTNVRGRILLTYTTPILSPVGTHRTCELQWLRTTTLALPAAATTAFPWCARATAAYAAFLIRCFLVAAWRSCPVCRFGTLVPVKSSVI